jgi:hypothetical protein
MNTTIRFLPRALLSGMISMHLSSYGITDDRSAALR